MSEAKQENVQALGSVHVQPAAGFKHQSDFSNLVVPVRPQSRCAAKLKCTKVFLLFFIEQIDKTGCQDGPGKLHPQPDKETH